MSTSKLNDLGGLIWQVSTHTTLAARIKEAFGDAKPSEIARATTVTNAAVTGWLGGGTKTLKGSTAARIEAATGFRAAWIVSGKGPRKVSDMAEPPTPEEMALIIDFRAMMADDQAELAAEIKRRACKTRDHVAKVMHALGVADPAVTDPRVEWRYSPAPVTTPHTVHEAEPEDRR